MIITDTKKTDYLHTVYVQDFGDSYHRLEEEPSTELEKDVKSIRRRYRDYHEYIRARRLYNEYMEYIYELHGGKKAFIFLRSTGYTFPNFIPHKPRIKSTVFNNKLAEQEIPMSRVGKNVDTELILGHIRACIGNSTPEMEFKSDDEMEKVARGVLSNTKIGKFKSIKSIDDPIDFLENYFNKSKNKKEEEDVYNDDSASCSLTELVTTDIYKMDDDAKDSEPVWYRGSFVARDTIDELKLYEQLNLMGWNTFKIMKDSKTSKAVTKVLKARKKSSKEEKKDRKKAKKRASKVTDGFLLSAASDNGYDDYNDFADDMLNFTADSLYK